MNSKANTFRINCGASDDLSLAIVNGDAVLATADHKDERQVLVNLLFIVLVHTSMLLSFSCAVPAPEFPQHGARDGRRRTPGRSCSRTGRLGYRNSGDDKRVHGLASPSLFPCSFVQNALKRLIIFLNMQVQLFDDCPASVDVALLWTQSDDDLGEGFQFLRTVKDISLVLDAVVPDGTPILVFPWHGGPNQKWKLLPFHCSRKKTMRPFH
jgi:hypothetical protein